MTNETAAGGGTESMAAQDGDVDGHPFKITLSDAVRAKIETERLSRELNIANADHIELWIERNTLLDEPMDQCASWLACRIVEAHEAALDHHKARADRAEAALREARVKCREVRGGTTFSASVSEDQRLGFRQAFGVVDVILLNAINQHDRATLGDAS